MSAHHQKVESLFNEALQYAPGQRSAFLAGACGNDAELRRQLEELLKAEAAAGAFLPEAPQEAVTLRLADTPDEAVGQTLGRYKLLERLGEGGCGVVYVAEQTEPVRRRVALKVIKLGMDTKQVVARFEAERQALAMMDHPNIARVLDAGATELGRPYFVMELVRGIPITHYCDQNNLATRERLDLFIKVCQAIQHAHQKGIIHRDIKPSNILVTLSDGAPVPKVIDFGIAKATEGRLTDNTVYTQLHQFIGTPAYMSPEQAEMTCLDIDTRSDIYSLGVLLYELLSGRTPFDARELMAAGLDAMRKVIREQEPARPSTRLATLKGDELSTTAKRRSTEAPKLMLQIEGDLDWIVMKAIDKDRTRRYETANAFAQDIVRFVSDQPVTARPPSAGYQFRKFARRNKVALRVVAAIAAVLVAGTAVSTWQAVRATKAEAMATERLVESEKARQDAEAILGFFRRVIEEPDPDKRKAGMTITLVDFLNQSAEKVKVEMVNQQARRFQIQVSIANSFASLGYHEKAIPLLEEALDHYSRGPVTDNTRVLVITRNLAGAYYQIGKIDKSIQLYEQTLQLSRRIIGHTDEWTLWVMGMLAMQYDYAGRTDDALAMRKEQTVAAEMALTDCREKLGRENPRTLEALTYLATCYRDLGREEEALALWEQLLSLGLKSGGPEARASFNGRRALSDAYFAAGRTKEALALREEDLRIRRRFYGEGYEETRYVMGNLAVSYEDAGRMDDAIKLREELLKLVRQMNVPRKQELLEILHQLAQSYDAVGRKDEAAKLREELESLKGGLK